MHLRPDMADDLKFAGATEWLLRNPQWKITVSDIPKSLGWVNVVAEAKVDGKPQTLGFSIAKADMGTEKYRKLEDALNKSMAQLCAMTPQARSSIEWGRARLALTSTAD